MEYKLKSQLLSHLHSYLVEQHNIGNINLCRRWLYYKNHFINDVSTHYKVGYSFVHLYNDKPLGPYNYRLVSVDSFSRNWQEESINYDMYKE